MKYSEFFKRRRNIYFSVILIVSLLLAGGIWQYGRFIEKQKDLAELQKNMSAYNKSAEDVDSGLKDQDPAKKKDEEKPVVTEVSKTDPSNLAALKDKTGTKSGQDKAKATTAFKAQSPKLETMIIPVFGSLGSDYSGKDLVYSETLEQWAAHKGIDIKADEGSPVRASMDGVIYSVSEDPQWGMTIVIDHGGKVLTKYSNLSTLDMIKEGQKVKKGDIISGVGKTALFEIADAPHLHFEITRNGKNMDPKTYLPKKSINR